MLNKMRNLLKEEQGQGMTEYGLLLAAVVTVVLVALVGFRDAISKLLADVTAKLSGAVDTATTP